MRNIYLIIAFLAIVSCKENANNISTESTPADASTGINQVEIVSVDQAKSLISTSNNLVILDVRTPEEVSQGTLPNATIIDINSPNFESEVLKLDKSKPTLVYCKAGVRSTKACELMNKAGFEKLYNMKEGYSNWK
jgi:rhodanese-related sulfurtransferase